MSKDILQIASAMYKKITAKTPKKYCILNKHFFYTQEEWKEMCKIFGLRQDDKYFMGAEVHIIEGE